MLHSKQTTHNCRVIGQCIWDYFISLRPRAGAQTYELFICKNVTYIELYIYGYSAVGVV